LNEIRTFRAIYSPKSILKQTSHTKRQNDSDKLKHRIKYIQTQL